MSERRFSVGDRVRIDCLGNFYHGEETTVVKVAIADKASFGRGGYFLAGETVYVLDLDDEKQDPALPARYLRPTYDGDEPAAWRDCVWRPDEAHA
jgi:hypothetical protein